MVKALRVRFTPRQTLIIAHSYGLEIKPASAFNVLIIIEGLTVNVEYEDDSENDLIRNRSESGRRSQYICLIYCVGYTICTHTHGKY